MQASERSKGRGRTSAIVSGLVGLVVLVGLGAVEVSAQAPGSCAPDEPLPLYSPRELTVELDTNGRLGNRLRWNPVEADLGRCATLVANPELEQRVGVVLEGVVDSVTYGDSFDRQISLTFSTTGQIGTTALEDVRLSIQDSNPNPRAGNIDTNLNLSSRGGFFRWNTVSGAAVQDNDGVPTHLPTTDVTDIARGADGTLYAALTRLPLLASDDEGQTWRETLEGTERPFTDGVRSLVASGQTPGRLWALTERSGLWRTDDGGATWTRDLSATSNPRARYNLFKRVDAIPPGQSTVQSVIFAHVSQAGLLYSLDDGMTYQPLLGVRIPSIFQSLIRCSNDVAADSTTITNDVEASRVDPGTLYVALDDWGVYEVDFQGGATTWIPRYDGLVICSEDLNIDFPAGRTRSVDDIVVLEPETPGVESMFVLTDRPPTRNVPPGQTPPPEFLAFRYDASVDPPRWITDAVGYLAPQPNAPVRADVAVPHPTDPRKIVAVLRDEGLWEKEVSAAGGADWQRVTYPAGNEVYTKRVGSLLELESGELLVGTTGSGAYRIGDPIDIDRAILLGVGPNETAVETGLRLRFQQPGNVTSGESMVVAAQSFQGYIVWRSIRDDAVTGEPLWEMVGLYDVTNPEACSEDPCDVVAPAPIPGCFGDKRANCFTVPLDLTRGEWGFYDRNVSAGFSYNYAVTTFDYGFAGATSPEGQTSDMVFSPRSALESNPQVLEQYRDLRGGDNYNSVFFQVNIAPAENLGNVFAVPNPFVSRAGWDTREGRFIRFFNVTDTSKIEIFTIAGDFVRELDNVIFNARETGLIEWDTRNAEGNEVASGVYIFRVTDAEGRESVSRLTLIR